MEEKENIGEQPQDVQPSLEENTNGSPSEEIEESVQTGEAERGVPIGKFKSVEDLFHAYENLQAEFTRKSQKLSALEKASVEVSEDEKVENALKAFLSKNQEAVVYAEELKTRVANDESLKKDESGFDKAWAGLLYEKLTSKDKTSEPIVQNLILKDDEIKDMVIKNYMKQLQEQKIPIVMSSNSGERVTKPVTPKPETFEDAKRMALDLFS